MKKETSSKKSDKKVALSRTLEEREEKCIAYATALAEKQLAEGKASSQIINHYLKRGSEKAKHEYEVEKLKYETELIKAKTEAVKSQQKTEELMREAITAIRHYQGLDTDIEADYNEVEDY